MSAPRGWRWLAMAVLWLTAGAALAAPLSTQKAVSLRQAVDDITLAAANHDMALVKVQPIDSALVKRGFDDPHMRILFIGSETAVRWAKEAEPGLLNLLPLRLTLIEREGLVTVMTDDFDAWIAEFPDNPANMILRAWRAELASMLEDFLRQ